MRLSPILSLAAVGAAALALNGCATLSEEQCLAGNWEGIGYRDGTQGYSWDRINQHYEACRDHGVAPDQTLYEQGRQQGLLSYCTPGSGFHAGRNASTYRGVCPGNLEGDFLAGYSDGRLVNAAQQAYDTAYNEEQGALSRARDLENQIRNEENALGAEGVTDEQRDAIRERLRRLRGDRERALDEAERSRWTRQRAERDVNDLRARFSAYYGSW